MDTEFVIIMGLVLLVGIILGGYLASSTIIIQMRCVNLTGEHVMFLGDEVNTANVSSVVNCDLYNKYIPQLYKG